MIKAHVNLNLWFASGEEKTDRKDISAVRNTCCSCRGYRFGPGTRASQLTTACDYNSRAWIQSFSFCRHSCTHRLPGTHTYT